MMEDKTKIVTRLPQDIAEWVDQLSTADFVRICEIFTFALRVARTSGERPTMAGSTMEDDGNEGRLLEGRYDVCCETQGEVS